jgi:hypothetical protein
MQPCRLQRLHDAVDRQSAETIRIVPQKAGGYVSGGADSSRAVIEIDAYVAGTPSLIRTSGTNANSGHNPEMRGATHTARFTTSAVPYQIVAGDLVTLLDEDGTPSLRVSAVMPFGFDRTTLLLVKLA